MPYDITEEDFNVPAPKERFDISESDFGPPPTKPYGRIRSFSSLPPAPPKLQPGEFAMLPVEEQRRMVEQQLDAEAEQARAEEIRPGMLATIARESAAGVIPALAAGAGYALGAPLGAGGGPVGSIGTGLAGSVLAGAAASDVQDAAAQAIAPEAYGRFKEQLEAGRQEYPIAAAAGRLIAALPTFSVSAPTTGLELAKRFGIGAGITSIPAVTRGELPSAQEVIEGGVGGAFLGEPRARILRAPVTMRGGESSASRIQEAAAVHGDMRPSTGESQGQVPAPQSQRGILTQTERGIPEVQATPSEVLLTKGQANEKAQGKEEALREAVTPEAGAQEPLGPSSFNNEEGILNLWAEHGATQKAQELGKQYAGNRAALEALLAEAQAKHDAARASSQKRYDVTKNPDQHPSRSDRVQALALDVQNIKEGLEIEKDISSARAKAAANVPNTDDYMRQLSRQRNRNYLAQQAEESGQPTPAAKASPEQLSPAMAEGEPSASVQQSPSAMAVGIAPPGTGIAEKIIDWARTLPAKLSGKAAPLTSRAAEESGNALVRFASSKIAAPQVAKARVTDVLGDYRNDRDFSLRLGAVLVEDRLRGLKKQFNDEAQRQSQIAQQQAQAGNTTAAAEAQHAAMEAQDNANNVVSIIGRTESPFAREVDFQNALNDPDIQAAINRHKHIVQLESQIAHEETGGDLAGYGLNTDAFVNLKAVLPGVEEFTGGTSKGNLDNPLKRFTKFGKEAKGTSEAYDVDYRTIAERMIKGNFEELSKRQLYDQLVNDGLAVVLPPGIKPPKINGQPTTKFTIERRGGRVENLWIRKDLAGEFRQAEDVEGPIEKSGLITAAQALNRIQLAGPTDAVWHVANMVGSIAGSQGGRNVLEELARKLPGVNVADALSRITASAIKVMRDTPEIQQQIADITRIGAGRAAHGGGMLSRLIGLVDKAGRLVRDDMYQNLVDRGLVTANEATRREWINQLGQYNPRLMGQFQRFFKEAGFSPFIVAGRNFNRMAARRITLDPGTKAANPAAYWEMKGIEAFGILATLVTVPSLINLATVGKPNGRPGVKFGQIDTGKDDASGKPIVIDPAQWTGLRRGLRISGAQAVIEGVKEGAPREKITQRAITDVLGGVIHPWAGPAVSAPYIAVTGKSPTQYKESENPNDYGANTKAALKQLNPVAEAILSGHEKDKTSLTAPLSEVGKSLGGAIGIKSVTPFTAQQSMYNAAHNWMKQSGNPKLVKKFEDSLKESEPSDYKPLRDALKANDQAKAKEEIAKLLQTKSRKDLGTAMLKHRDYPFSGAKATEGKFIRSLTPEQRIMLDKAKEERRAEYRRFREVFSK